MGRVLFCSVTFLSRQETPNSRFTSSKDSVCPKKNLRCASLDTTVTGFCCPGDAPRISCRDGRLNLEGHASGGGSDGLYNETYMGELAKLGAYPLWNEVFAQSGYVRDCLENCSDLAHISTSYSVDWEEASEWLESERAPLECSSIHFASLEELAKNTETTRAAYQPHSPHADALQS